MPPLPLPLDFGDGSVMGEGLFVSAGVCVLDIVMVRPGDHVLADPRCRVAASSRPRTPWTRGCARDRLYAAPVTMEDDCRTGGVTVRPGVTIGARSVVAAAVVVAGDTPADSHASGCQTVVKRCSGSGARSRLGRD